MSPRRSLLRAAWLLLAWLLLAAPLATAASCAPPGAGQAVSLASCLAEGQAELSPALRFLEDPRQALRLEDVLARPPAAWQRSAQATPNMGIGTSAYWFELTVVNHQPGRTRYVVEVPHPTMDHLDLYVLQGGQLVAQFKSGDQRPFSTRPVAHRHFVFPIDLPAGQEVRLLMRAASAGSLQMPVMLWEPAAFLAHEQKMLPVQMVFVGVMLAMVLYNGFIFFVIRDRTYLWYTLSMLTITGVVLSFQGILAQFVWPELPALNNPALLAFITANVCFASIFAYSFLGLHRFNRGVRWWFLMLAGSGVVGFLLNLVLPYAVMVRLAGAISVVAATSCIVMGLYLSWRGEVLAKFYSLAWSVLLAGSVLITFSKMGMLPRNILLEHAQQIGAAVEAMLLSFALAYRISEERRKRYVAQRELLRVQQEANEALEHKVKERTLALQEANRRLQEANSVDGLTQVKNRFFFDEMLAHEWRRGSRAPAHLSLVMIDADHFKAINDTHGHLAGDACLRHLAHVAQGAVQRAGDVVARYGGEEFVLLLCNTSADGAAAVAERIRARVQDTPLLWEGRSIPFRVSMGVACCTPGAGRDMKWLIQRADEALYEAKRKGRNRVVVAPMEDQPAISCPSTT